MNSDIQEACRNERGPRRNFREALFSSTHRRSCLTRYPVWSPANLSPEASYFVLIKHCWYSLLDRWGCALRVLVRAPGGPARHVCGNEGPMYRAVADLVMAGQSPQGPAGLVLGDDLGCQLRFHRSAFRVMRPILPQEGPMPGPGSRATPSVCRGWR